VERLEAGYGQAHVTAHLEVPGAMFELAVRAQRQGRGVVGSTADILGYIRGRVASAVAEGAPRRLQFVLGTEAGMVTSVVRAVRACSSDDVEVEIVFPVADDAVAVTQDAFLPIVPGVDGGEGCSAAGGCATCPYMKLNSFEALVRVLEGIGVEDLSAYEPEKYAELIRGRSVAELGARPISHMREFQRTGELGEALLAEIEAHARARAS
jgi:quinolinate synthase